MTLRISIPMPDRLTHYVLTGALGGGSGYWLRDYSPRAQSNEISLYVALHLNMPREGAECDAPVVLHSRIGAARIAHGIELALTSGSRDLVKCAARALTGDMDAADADVILQLAVFEEVIYG